MCIIFPIISKDDTRADRGENGWLMCHSQINDSTLGKYCMKIGICLFDRVRHDVLEVYQKDLV